MDARVLRAQSLKTMTKLGFPLPTTLPLLDEELHLRGKDQVLDRLLCLHAVAACSYGFDRQAALKWLHREKLEWKLTRIERDFLTHARRDPGTFKVQVEGMWALGLVKDLDFAKDCDNRFVQLMPDLKTDQGCDAIRKKSRLQNIEAIAAHCDLAYSLHWAIRQASIDGKQLPIAVQPYVVIERRRALEWVLSNEDWDSVSLDT